MVADFEQCLAHHIPGPQLYGSFAAYVAALSPLTVSEVIHSKSASQQERDTSVQAWQTLSHKLDFLANQYGEVQEGLARSFNGKAENKILRRR